MPIDVPMQRRPWNGKNPQLYVLISTIKNNIFFYAPFYAPTEISLLSLCLINNQTYKYFWFVFALRSKPEQNLSIAEPLLIQSNLTHNARQQ